MSQIKICDKCGRKIDGNKYYNCEVNEISINGVAILSRKHEYDACNACWENTAVDCQSL